MPPTKHLDLVHLILNRPGDIVDGHFGGDAVVIKQVDAVRPQALQPIGPLASDHLCNRAGLHAKPTTEIAKADQLA